MADKVVQHVNGTATSTDGRGTVYRAAQKSIVLFNPIDGVRCSFVAQPGTEVRTHLTTQGGYVGISRAGHQIELFDTANWFARDGKAEYYDKEGKTHRTISRNYWGGGFDTKTFREAARKLGIGVCVDESSGQDVLTPPLTKAMIES
jgi:acetamidase/formamidase